MIRYKAGIVEKLHEAGYNTNRIRQEKIFGQSHMTDFRRQAEIPYKTLNKLCKILKCEIGDIIEYVEDDAAEGDNNGA